MDTKIKAAIISLTLLLNGCSTLPKSLMLGTAVGGATGVALMQSQSQSEDGGAMGFAIGAAVGWIVSYLAFQNEKAIANRNLPDPPAPELLPYLTKPKIKSYIVPDTIEGNKYIKSHKVFIVEDPGTWTK